ncbi:hypothetical protein QOZ88_02705 [Blastococcus sp. BMG 814]|uniref:Glycosyltransferase RgtA/B/C/D-like domain-containing protein n=1 Tax=Blastococcus carthaginiensis TaxID=3050034 RepID=A0ABT9I7J1_9ACTN|nr:hypothetical protein [Blastococcus carthaginiensis]MDP5181534.1 hypothetical protein [Blastococcus carthaginiensis]
MLRTTCSRYWPVVAIAALFAVSVLLRLPALGMDPIQNSGWTPYQRLNNANVWIHNQYVLEVYGSNPILGHKFASYIGTDPQFLRNAALPQLTVYTSFPSTHFVVLHLALNALGLGMTYAASQVFGLLLHGASVALVAYLVLLLTRNKVMAVTGAAMYTFSTGTLWYHMNVYWSHELLVPVFLASLVVFVRRAGRPRRWQAFLIGAAMTAVTWTGAVAAVGWSLYGLYKHHRTKDRAFLANLFAAVGMVTALVLITAHVLVTTRATPLAYLRALLNRAEVRSATGAQEGFPLLSWRFVNALVLDYGGFLLAALVVALIVGRLLSTFQWEVVLLSAFPLLESFLLLEHDFWYGFGRLKWLLPAILLICLAGANLGRRGTSVLVAAVGAAALAHVALYFVVFEMPPVGS